MVLDAIEGDSVTKADFAVFQEKFDSRFAQVRNEIRESEFRVITRLGFLVVSTVSIAVAVLGWLIKV